MKPSQRLLPLFILQIFPILFPFLINSEGMLNSLVAQAGAAAVLFLVLAYGLFRGRSWALALSIFIQGLNIIVRLMMLFPHAMTSTGQLDIIHVAWNLTSMLISTWFMLRLDKPDVRATLVA